MRQESNEHLHPEPCPEFEQGLILYAADELDRDGRAIVEGHIRTCATCAAALAREQRLVELVAASGPIEPATGLLASCRGGLDEALDQAEENAAGGAFSRWLTGIFGASWFALHPAWSAVLFILIGFSVGSIAPRWLRQPNAPAPAALGGAMPVAALGNRDLRGVDVSGINWMPTAENEAPRVQLQLSSEQPMMVQGTVDNSDVKRVLLYVLRNNERFGPDVRLDSVELLKNRSDDAEVRQALCHAVHTDRNAAVRLRALEALQGAEPQDIIRQTLLDALVDDANPGVRIEAINTLRQLAGKGAALSDPGVIKVLRERMRKDPNAYIRLQSAAAIRDLGPREKY